MDFWRFNPKEENTKFGVSSGIANDKSKGRVRTTRVNSISSCIPDMSSELRETKNGEPVKKNQFSAWVSPEVHISLKLDDIFSALSIPAELRARSFCVATTTVSGWQDSNLRPPRPKRGAMTGLRYTPKFF